MHLNSSLNVLVGLSNNKRHFGKIKYIYFKKIDYYFETIEKKTMNYKYGRKEYDFESIKGYNETMSK